jgi:ABC-2 type transport system ATP-binding protein
LLAQAMVHNPDLLIMDEPVANLDPKARIDFFKVLMKLRKQGKAIFISSHVLAELDRYSNALTILDGGKIIYSGDKDNLLKQFEHNSYVCETDNLKKTKQIVKSMKITILKNSEHKTLKLSFINQQQIDDFQKEILQQKVHFIKFAIIEPTLDDVYNKLVIKGSVDTMEK